MTFRLVAISAGLSQPSSTRLLTDRLTAAASAALRARGQDVEATTIELRPLAHEITDAMLLGFAPDSLSEALSTVARADALIAVTPIFAGSYAGLFKSFIDVLPRGDLAGKPVLIAATGGSARHSLALDHAVRPLFAYHQAVTVPTGVFAATGDFGPAGPTGAEAGGLGARIDRAARELVQLAGPAGQHATDGLDTRPAVAPTREETASTEFTPFAQLLGERTRALEPRSSAPSSLSSRAAVSGIGDLESREPASSPLR